MKIDITTGSTHMNASGSVYYSAEIESGERVYSFTPDFEDVWTQSDEDAVNHGSTPSKF